MSRRISAAKSVLLVAALTFFATACGEEAHRLSPQGHYRWLHMQGNLLAQQKLIRLGALGKSEVLFTNVKLVDVVAGTIRNNASVLVRDGKIVHAGADVEINDLVNIVHIDGEGQYLAPGLTDMHVHTHDDSDYLLHLAFGVTTIREMNGWPWRLERRRMLEAGKILAPNMFITSRILNSSDFGGYAIALDSEEQAREAVRKAKSDGYDAIKIHNGLTKNIFFAIVDEANANALDVVGHIPVRVPVSEAIAAGMHTSEHFKGYIDDRNLEISEEDWLTPSIDTTMYITPTFYSSREHLRADQAKRVLDESAKMVLPHRRLAWQGYAQEQADGLTQLRQSIRPKSESIFKTLLPHNIRWLAGTDSGGYELMVPGEALIEELEIMEGLGLTAPEALRSATSRAATAMNWSDRTGRIAPGMNADLILLSKNPLETVSNLRSLRAVMVRGIWITDPSALIVNGDKIDASAAILDRSKLEEAVELAEQHAAAGYAQSTISLEMWTQLAEEVGASDLSERLAALSLHF